MTKREAKKTAWYHAYRALDSLVVSGWPYEMQDNEDPPESDADLQRLTQAMDEIIQFCYERSGR